MGTHWIKLRSGIIVQAKDVHFSQNPVKTSFSRIGDMAVELEDLYSKYSIQLSAGSRMATRIRGAKDLKVRWETEPKNTITGEMIINAINFQRIAGALLPLDGNDKAEFFLNKLLDGDLDITKRTPNVGKSFLWELELWNKMTHMGLHAEFKEPDISWEDKGDVLGVACKRLYSEKHVQHVLSEAVAQIKETTHYGIAAFNLDDLVVPADQIFHAHDKSVVLDWLTRANQDFLVRNHRHFEKYFLSNRLAGVIVSTSCLSRLDTLYVASQWTVWTHPELDADNKRRIQYLYEKLSAGSSAGV
ncbi:MAG: hypothetical protein A2020_00350 [Lentisphaerae bacterium GWF2_45_14]|nr:MAG: hypothetical protein A2020_00350 [Lentisphaerae bacterium GWF2_45_14]